jgi:hypothetical protein
MAKNIQKEIGEIFAVAGYKYDSKDVLLLIAVTDQFNRSGYKLGYIEVAKFVTNKKNKSLVEKDGLTKTIEAMASMRLGTIKRNPVPGRNEKCTCGSGKKFKKCCINK